MVLSFRELFLDSCSVDNCHPEAKSWPKDLPRCIKLECARLALWRKSSCKSRDIAIKSEIFREIPSASSGPTPGLRMTVVMEALL
jgi:hypothetical protein